MIVWFYGIKISEWRVKVAGNQSCVRFGRIRRLLVYGKRAGTTGAESIGVAPWCSDRVSSLVEYERRLNSLYGEGQQKFQVSKYVSLAELVDAPDLLYIVSW